MAAKQTKAKTSADKGPHNNLVVGKKDGESEALALARVLLAPDFRHAMVAQQLLGNHNIENANPPGLGDYADILLERGRMAEKGDLAFASKILAAQASTLDNIFAEMARRMACNIGQYPDAMEKYGRMAMKAQANSRATLEALAKLHQPREQTVRHVHVGQGGQAVVTDEFHHHAGGTGNGKGVEQCHAADAPGASSALPGPDQIGDAMPIPGGVREAAMSDARRQ